MKETNMLGLLFFTFSVLYGWDLAGTEFWRYERFLLFVLICWIVVGKAISRERNRRGV